MVLIPDRVVSPQNTLVTHRLLSVRSTDAQTTWGAPQPFPSASWASATGDHYPALASARKPGAPASTWVAVWVTDRPTSDADLGPDLDVVFSRSADGGLTWSTPAPIVANVLNDSDTAVESPTIATDGQGNWVVAWATNRDLPGITTSAVTNIAVSRSSDDGQTWSPPITVSIVAGSEGVGDDLDPRVAFGAGRWFVTWWEYSWGAPCYLCRSDDSGATWSSAASPSKEQFAYGSRPAIASDQRGRWMFAHTFWVIHFPGAPSFFIIDTVKSSNNGATWFSSWDLSVHGVGPIDVVPDQFGAWVIGKRTGVSSTAFTRDFGATWGLLGRFSYWSPRIACGNDGRYVAVWYDRTSNELPSGHAMVSTVSASTAQFNVPSAATPGWVSYE